MYIGKKKVKESHESDGRVKVIFEDGSEVAFTPKMFEASLSQEPLDDTLLQERRVVAVQTEIMKLLVDWDMKLVDIQRMYQMSANFIQQKHEFADEKFWGNTYLERTIGDIEKVFQRQSDKGNPV